MYDWIGWIGWIATVMTGSSYFFRQPGTLRRIQGVAAVLWGTYGALIHSLPVLVANIFVASAAFGSLLFLRRTPSA
jgi:hypothetical protein